jgi:glycosyltransferase involved in cell wall biosynthesis
MESGKTIIFLSEMPITNGVIQAQLLSIVLAAARSGYEIHLMETIGRFDSQEEGRNDLEKELKSRGVNLFKIKVPRHTMLPSILYFTLKSCFLIRKIKKNNRQSKIIIYARNYKFCLVLIINKIVRKISFIYSPRGAYVAERKYYKKIKDRLYGFFIGIMEKRAIEKSAATIAETNGLKEHLEKIYNLNNTNIKVISNYYDQSLVSNASASREEMRKKLDFQGKKVIVYAGTVEVWYDFSKMFDLASRLKKKDPSIFFQLFTKEDYARDESRGMAGTLRDLAKKYNLKEKEDYAISSYPPGERYRYLAAADAGICLTTPEKFKTMMLYLKIVDYLGAGLPIIVNSEVKSVVEIIKNSGVGAVVDYHNWDNSISKIDTEKLFRREDIIIGEYQKFSSQNILPRYLELFGSVFKSVEK